MAQIELGIAKGQLVALPFGQLNVAASQTDVQLPVAGVAGGAEGYTMPFAGAIVGLSYDLSAAGSAGTLAVGATIDGTERAATTQAVGTTTAGRARFGRDAHPFAAGARIGAEITTSAAWDGITADLAVLVWVVLDVEGI